MSLNRQQGSESTTLLGVTVLVTRPRAQSDSLCKQIENAGGKVIRFPVIDIVPVAVPVADSLEPDIVIYTSVNAVQYGVTVLTQFVPSATRQIAAIGQATARALQQAGVKVDILPNDEFTTEALLALPQMKNVSGKKITIVKGEGGRELMAGSLTSSGAIVSQLDVYRRVIPDINTDEVLQACLANRLDVILITSTNSLTNLFTLLGEHGRNCLQAASFIVISERIREACKPFQLKLPVQLAAGGSDAALMEALQNFVQRRTRDR